MISSLGRAKTHQRSFTSTSLDILRALNCHAISRCLLYAKPLPPTFKFENVNTIPALNQITHSATGSGGHLSLALSMKINRPTDPERKRKKLKLSTVQLELSIYTF